MFYLQHQPKLVSVFGVLLVEHAVELHHVGMIRKRFQDVVLCLNLLVDILKQEQRVRVKPEDKIRLATVSDFSTFMEFYAVKGIKERVNNS